MDIDAFLQSIQQGKRPTELRPPLTALWHAAQGDWKRAHEIVQEESDVDSAWVHAYLHRQEGDLSNAGYWYRRAGKSKHSGSLDDELRAIAAALL